MRRINFHIALSFTLAALASFSLKAEGTKELLDGDCSNDGYLQIWDNGDINRPFATYACAPEYRLNIRLRAGETLHFGYNTNVEDVWFRIKDPNDTRVMGPTLVTSSSSNGWISSCGKAVKGPKAMVGGGYSQLSYTAVISGDHYIEFAVGNDSSTRSKRIFWQFDATVDSAGTIKRGRLWSKNWDMTTNGGSNTLEAKLFAYSSDSIVTSFDFNGMRPYGFAITCNSFGATDQGTLDDRRLSNYRATILTNGGSPGAPEFPIFLNDPDPALYPSGDLGLLQSVGVQGCVGTNQCIEAVVTKGGQIEVEMTFENNSTRIFVDTVVAGTNCINWDGEDGFGNPVSADDTVWVTATYKNGVTHLPLVDVEHHNAGYTVRVVRPRIRPNGSMVDTVPAISWADSLLTDPANSYDGVSNLPGCLGTCHQWGNRGTNNANPEVINTWWSSNEQDSSVVYICPESGVLPVQLLDFTVSNTPEGIQLIWNVAVEIDINVYEVERITRNGHFQYVGEVISTGSGSSYRFIDRQTRPGEYYYYRLRMKGTGTDDLSNTLTIQRDGSGVALDWVQYGHSFRLHHESAHPIEYIVTNGMGQIVDRGTAHPGMDVSISGGSSGVYFLQFGSDSHPRETHRFVRS